MEIDRFKKCDKMMERVLRKFEKVENEKKKIVDQEVAKIRKAEV